MVGWVEDQPEAQNLPYMLRDLLGLVHFFSTLLRLPSKVPLAFSGHAQRAQMLCVLMLLDSQGWYRYLSSIPRSLAIQGLESLETES